MGTESIENSGGLEKGVDPVGETVKERERRHMGAFVQRLAGISTQLINAENDLGSLSEYHRTFENLPRAEREEMVLVGEQLAGLIEKINSIKIKLAFADIEKAR